MDVGRRKAGEPRHGGFGVTAGEGAEMGGDAAGSSEGRATETSVRGFWKAWRSYMGM